MLLRSHLHIIYSTLVPSLIQLQLSTASNIERNGTVRL